MATRHAQRRNTHTQAHRHRGQHMHRRTRPPALRTSGPKRARGGARGQSEGGSIAQHSATAQTALPRTPRGTQAPQEAHPHTPPAARSKDRIAGRGRASTPDAYCNGWRYTPEESPATLAARNAQQGTQTTEPMLGPHACSAAPTACGKQTAAACPNDGQPEEGQSLTPDAPHAGTWHLHPVWTSRHSHSTQCQLARGRALRSVLGPHTRSLLAGETRATGPGYLPERWSAGRGRAPDHRRPSHRRGGAPPGKLTPTQRSAMPHRARKPKGQCRVPAPAHPHPQHVGSSP